MNELQKLNHVSYKVILLNTGYFPFDSWVDCSISVSISIACAALLVGRRDSRVARHTRCLRFVALP
jgi:hypothetical protein